MRFRVRSWLNTDRKLRKSAREAILSLAAENRKLKGDVTRLERDRDYESMQADFLRKRAERAEARLREAQVNPLRDYNAGPGAPLTREELKMARDAVERVGLVPTPLRTEEQDTIPPDNLLAEAWRIIANGSGWFDSSPTGKQWREAAIRWRDMYFDQSTEIGQSTVEIGGQTMTEAQFNAARRPLQDREDAGATATNQLLRLTADVPDMGDRVEKHSETRKHSIAFGCCIDCPWTVVADYVEERS